MREGEDISMYTYNVVESQDSYTVLIERRGTYSLSMGTNCETTDKGQPLVLLSRGLLPSFFYRYPRTAP